MIVVKCSLTRGDSKSTKNVWCFCCNQERGFISCVYVRKIVKRSWGEIACNKVSNMVNLFTQCEGSGYTYKRSTIISLCSLYFPYSIYFSAFSFKHT